MFNYVSETILNDLSRVLTIDNTDDPTIPSGEDAVFVKKLGKFPQYNSVSGVRTEAVYKRVGTNPVNEVATIALAGVTLADLVGKVIRITLDVRLSGSEDGEYSRWAVHKGQPFYAEYFVATLPTSIAALTTALAANFNKALSREGTYFVQVTAATTNLVVTATDEHQRFAGAKLELIADSQDDFPGLIATGTVTTAGKEGFGTSWFITKNLRLPTVENLRFKGIHQDELPIANSLYNQYTFKLVGERGPMGQSVVGQDATSVTYHVFYVLQTLAATFESSLTDILAPGGIVTV